MSSPFMLAYGFDQDGKKLKRESIDHNMWRRKAMNYPGLKLTCLTFCTEEGQQQQQQQQLWIDELTLISADEEDGQIPGKRKNFTLPCSPHYISSSVPSLLFLGLIMTPELYFLLLFLLFLLLLKPQTMKSDIFAARKMRNLALFNGPTTLSGREKS